MRFVVSFDIACARRRRRVTRLLLAHGERIQESVFELLLRDSQWQRVAARMNALVDPVQDQWRGWCMCERDHADMAELGLPSPSPYEGAVIV